MKSRVLLFVFLTVFLDMIGFGIVMMSLAEMASMAPISGGQYHWVSEFAPPKYQKFLSYMVGTWYPNILQFRSGC